MKENKALEENYQQEKSQHKNTKEELEQSIKELQIQLKQANDQNEVMCNTIEQLEVNLQQGEEKIISIEEKYLKEVDAHGITKDMFSQTAERFQDKMNQGREGNQNFEEKYEDEKSSHKETQEELVQANQQNKEKSAKIKELEFQLQQAVEENTWTNETYRKERSAHKHTKKQLNCLEEIYEKEKSERINTNELEHLQRTLEELGQAKCENKIMKEKLEEIEQLKGNGKNYEDLQVPQPQTQDKQFKEDLHACLSVISDTKTLKQRFIAMKRRYLDNEQLQISEIVEQECQLENKDLAKKLYGCQNLLKVKSDTISRLEQQLLTAVQQCAEREKKYVKILNRHIVMEHQLKKELEKVSKPIPQRVSSWWHEKVLKSNIFDTSQDDEEELNLYPEDWRLPEFPDDEKLLDI
ncbi:trichoplein keratin filament-binding protein-like [Takifugu flavidus]|uniref:trichoplein keratin filament-binding protein-like n=1 Tax=Takifugu flavidus TaxID=433684 RepID=UPI002544577C|nr:trichoplein keratin filament-binding protein-like [Takifugu flavidus]